MALEYRTATLAFVTEHYIPLSPSAVALHISVQFKNNNEYLERLTRTGPKRLHVRYKYILSKFNAYNMNAYTYT